MKHFLTPALICMVLAGLWSCQKTETDPDKVKMYKGPVMDVSNMETLFSDSARVKVRLTAARQLEMENGDRYYPEGVHIDFYDKKGAKQTILTANKGRFKKDRNLYTVTGNVVVTNLEKQETLKTEILNWSQPSAQVFTEKFVTIQTPTEILKGEGLDAKQDFSRYRIRKPTGVFPIAQ